jgi:polyhydroxybutyrate depolymerase
VEVDRSGLRTGATGLLVLVGVFVLVGMATVLGLPEHASAASPSCPAAPTPGEHWLRLQVGALTRSVLVHVPPGLAAGESPPLVLALHGYGGSGPKMEPYSGLSALADQDHFVVAYPSADGLAWNNTAAGKGPDDVEFLGQTITYLERSDCVDPQRVFATGVSNGGSMVARAACELSGQIAAIAPVAGDYDRQPPCRPSRPVSVLEIHGTGDRVAPYFGPGLHATTDGVPPFVNGWVQRDGCAGPAATRQLAPRTRLYSWSHCSGQMRVEHIQIRAGRHQWPGAHPADPGPPSTICAACTIWAFFASLPTDGRVWPASGGAGEGAG